MIRLGIILVSCGALIAAAVIFAGGPGTRFGLWEYGTGFTMMRTATPFAMFFTVASAIAFVIAMIKVRGLALFAGLAVIVGAAGIYGPMTMRAKVAANPFIHDITTDFENPPQIIAAAALPRKNPPQYVGGNPAPRAKAGVSIADAQRAAFPDIVPVVTDADPEVAISAARRVLADMKLAVLAEGPLEAPDGLRIEAVHTSFWYGFKDDFIVRISPLADGGTRIDVRSKSRIGLSDIGANAARIRDFTKRLNAALG